ncbi:Hypothetical predicted protein [Olea europaea subsp. europaea]|uniref:Uncharacterized protein n=1 Tax=Olea europaea subsp. europaea TaxID=158383 RepID=A0A8S0S4J8_OLEEU|nr:Hypothetical predicted protein [Olea europaea subsp. europaea]
MEFTGEWKSLWPISSAFSPPLLLSNQTPNKPLGPIIFTPSLNTPINVLLESPSLAPRFPLSYPQLPLSRFLQKYCSTPSTAASISSLFGPQLPDYSTHFSNFNALQLLRIPNKNLIIVFFPTGENYNQVGFTLLSLEDSKLSVTSTRENFFTVAKGSCINHHRITRLLVNPVSDEDTSLVLSNDYNSNSVTMVGFLMVCTEYSVYWYKVCIISVVKGTKYCSVNLDYAGCTDSKTFKGKAVVSTCWSPHLREECLVLLDNGDLLMFDINESCIKKGNLGLLGSARNRTLDKKLRVSLSNKVRVEKDESGSGEWFGCEFSWHPRIFIVAHSDAIFLVDLSCPGICNVNCVLKVEMLSNVNNDGFVALSRVGYDAFCFTVSTKHLLLLCDVRKPMMPLLRWLHGLGNPRYMTVLRLSELRSNAKVDDYKCVSESGYCILLGSFWDCEFSLFCFGSKINRSNSVSSKNLKFCNLYYAWGLPTEISLSGYNCNCGSCFLREEFSKSALPDWIDWRQKIQVVMGFGILDADLFAELSRPNSFGGFVLIRLMSSGKLEAQQYHAEWESEKYSEIVHKTCIHHADNLLYDTGDAEYKLEKKFQHLKFDCLNAYLEDNLAKYIVERRENVKESSEDVPQRCNVASKSNFHQEICHKLKAFRLPRLRSSLAFSDVIEDISLPTSVNEIALRSTWASLPTNLLQLAFCTYSEFLMDLEKHKEPLEFLDIPDKLQLLPFPFRKPSRRSNKWSDKVQPSDALVGPVLPHHLLTILHKLCMEELKKERQTYLEETEAFSINAERRLQYKKVMEVIQELAVSDSDTRIQDDDFVSLADDKDEISYNYETQKSKFSYHKPLAFSENSSDVDVMMRKSGFEIDRFSTFVFRKTQEHKSNVGAEMVGLELFDVGCPIALKFDDYTIDFGPNELEAYQNLKKLDLEFQKGFNLYQDYITRGKSLK